VFGLGLAEFSAIATLRECGKALPLTIDLIFDGSSILGSPLLPEALAALQQHIDSTQPTAPPGGAEDRELVVHAGCLPPPASGDSSEGAGPAASSDGKETGWCAGERAVILGARGVVLAKVSVTRSRAGTEGGAADEVWGREGGGSDASVVLAGLLQSLTELCCESSHSHAGAVPAWLCGGLGDKAAALEPAECDVLQCAEVAQRYLRSRRGLGCGRRGRDVDSEEGAGEGASDGSEWSACVGSPFDSRRGGGGVDASVVRLLVERWLMSSVVVHSLNAASSVAVDGEAGVAEEEAWWGRNGGGWWGGGGEVCHAEEEEDAWCWGGAIASTAYGASQALHLEP
jgi:hypothetical protein